MVVSLKPEVEKAVQAKVSAGLFDSPEELVNAVLEQFMATDDFQPGELDQLLAVGEAQARAGQFVDGEEAFRKIENLSKSRSR